MLKKGDYKMWRLRIEQYFQVEDYALWDVIKNGNSFKLVAQTITNDAGTSTTLIPSLVTTEKKAQKKNDVKARSLLLMALPNEHLMTCNQYKDAKTLFAATQTRFGGNEATKKTQKTLLKQMYKNFSEPILQEDLNLKILRSIPSEWNTHVVVWRNKLDLDIMSFDDLYNNFKIVKQEVKETTNSSSSSNSQNMAFVSSPSSTNEVNTVYGVSTANIQANLASTQVNTASTQVSTANLSDATVYAFLASQPKGSQIAHDDLVQIHEDNLEEMDMKWQLALLSMRKRILMAYDEVPTNMALMAFSDSEVHNDKTCSKTYLKSFETLKTQLDNLRIEFNKFEFNLAIYKRGLASMKEKLIFYKKNKVLFCEQITVLIRDNSYKDSEISVLKSELKKLTKEKENNQLKIVKFDNASKNLDKLIGSQIPNNGKKGLGYESYHSVPSPPIGLFSPPKLDFFNSSLEEFQQPEFEGYGPKTSKSVSEDISNEVKESPDAPLVKKLVSDDKLEKKIVFPTVVKIEFVRAKQQEKPVIVNQVNAIKALACWVWRPTKPNGASVTLKRHNYIDVRGRSKFSRHMTRNMFYLSDFKEFNEGYVTFGGGAKEEEIIVKELLKVATLDESMLWHKRLGHINFKNINKLVKDKLVRGLPSKCFENDQTGVACLRGKQHKASSTKDETTCIFKKFITEIEKLVDKKVKVIRCDNGIEFKNSVMNDFYIMKGIRREFSIARTPQQNVVAEKRNRTQIKAAGTISFRKFDGKSDDGFFVGYSLNSKAFRVYNLRTRKVEENLHIRDSNEKKLIQMIKIHTDQNVADLLTKAFDVGRFQYLVAKKPIEFEGFEQIINFLDANPIKYALTVNPTIYTSCIKQFWATTKVEIVNREEQIQALVDKKRLIIIETSVRSDIHIEDAKDEHVTTTSNDLLLNGDDRLKLIELMELYTQLQSRVLALETTKANQKLEIRSLKIRVKKLEKKANKKTHKLKRLYKIGLVTDINKGTKSKQNQTKPSTKRKA
nr:hypothetical protein [Tanacetum cinerariifolium]